MADRIEVLLVDEDPEVLELTEIFLQRADEDLAVTTVQSGPEALERIESDGIDCIVTDYKMPEMNGLELTREVRAFDPDLPVILFTAKSDSVRENSEAAGVTGYVSKGTGSEQYEELASKIREAVR